MFVVRETIRHLRSSWAASVLQVLTLGVALSVTGLFALVAWSAHDAMDTLRANLAIEAFFDPTLSSTDALTIANNAMAHLRGVRTMVFISKEQALTDYAKMSGEDVAQVLGMNPLPASVKLYLQRPTSIEVQRISEQVQAIPAVQEVKSDAPLIATMEARSNSLNRIAIALGSLLIISALFQSLAAARHTQQRRRETENMLARLGAKKVTLAVPIVASAVLVGLCSGLAGALMMFLTHTPFFSALNELAAIHFSQHEYALLCIAMMGMGIVLSVIPTFIARWHR